MMRVCCKNAVAFLLVLVFLSSFCSSSFAQGSQVGNTSIWVEKVYLYPVDDAKFVENSDVLIAGKVEVDNFSDAAVHARLGIKVYKWNPNLVTGQWVDQGGVMVWEETTGGWVEADPDIDDDTDIVPVGSIAEPHTETLKVGPATHQYSPGLCKVEMTLTLSELQQDGHAGDTIAIAKWRNQFNIYEAGQAPPLVTVNPNPSTL